MNNAKQEKILNLISMISLILVMITLMVNIITGDEDNQKNTDAVCESAEALTTVEQVIAGIDSEIIKGTTENVTVVKEEESTIADAGETNFDDEVSTDFSPGVSSKEYNNVTSGKLSETSYVKSDYFENTIFLGDSRTVALKAHGFIKAENTFAVNGISHIGFMTEQFTDSVTGVSGDIFDIVKERKPEKIYVALGVNGVAFLGRNEFMNGYEKLIDKLMKASPDSTIIVQCILPVNEVTYTGKNRNLNNANIDAINVKLLEMTERKGIFFLDIANTMKNEGNQLADIYDNGDGIHYSFTGYSVVYDGICRHGVD